MSFTFHGKSFTSTGLSICKNGTVVTCQDLLDQRSGHNFVYIYLLGVGSKNPVKWKGFRQRALFHHVELFIVSSLCFYNCRRTSSLLLGTDRSGREKNADMKIWNTRNAIEVNALTELEQTLGYFGFCLSFLYVSTRSSSEQDFLRFKTNYQVE